MDKEQNRVGQINFVAKWPMKIKTLHNKQSVKSRQRAEDILIKSKGNLK